jgi:hypothetical protein
MNDVLFTTLFPTGFVIFFGLLIGEFLLSSLWAPVYFRYGIPLLRRHYSVRHDLNLAGYIPDLEANLGRKGRLGWRPAVVFRSFNPTELAFRQPFGHRNQVKGMVRLEPGNGRLTISGHLPFSSLPVAAFLMLVIWLSGVAQLFILLMVGILALAIFLQRHHYAQIAQIISQTLGAESFSPLNSTLDTAVPPFAPALPSTSLPNKPTFGLSAAEIILLVVVGVLGLAAAGLLFNLLSQ